MTNVSDIIVVGGGIGGLAAALSVQESGKSVAIFEQAPEFGEVGAGIQLAPNALEVLDRLGVKEEILKLNQNISLYLYPNEYNLIVYFIEKTVEFDKWLRRL